MSKSKYALWGALVMALVFFCVLNACSDMGYEPVSNAAMPVIVAQPRGLSIEKGDPAVFTVEAKGGSLTYQWYSYTSYRTYEDQTGKLLTGETDKTFTVPVGATAQEGVLTYYVVVTNTDNGANGKKVNSVKSAPAIVTIYDPNNAPPPIITSQPASLSDITWGRNMAIKPLEVIAEGLEGKSDEIRYQWYLTDDFDTSSGIPIEGATGSVLIPPVLVKGDTPDDVKISEPGNYYYYAVITNFYFDAPGRRESSLSSNPVLVPIVPNPNAVAPVISGHPSSAIYFNGDTVEEMKVVVDDPDDDGDLTYQWYSNSSSSNTGGSVITGATSDTYTPPVSTSTQQRYYYFVEVTNTNSFATNNKKAALRSRVAEVNVTSPVTKTANATFSVLFGNGGADQHQYVRGFGGMDVTWGNFPDYSVKDYENMFNPDILGYNMVRLMILPHNIDINKTMSDLIANRIYTTMDRSRYYENVKTVNNYGGYVLASPWSPPAAWKTNNSINGGGDLRKTNYQDYANYLRAYAQNMLNNGAPVYAISIQNEPNYTAGYDGCEWTGAQMRDFYDEVGHFTDGIAGYGGGKMIPSVKTMNGESANTVDVNKPAYSLATARNNIDIFGRHNYGSRNTNAASSDYNWIYNTTNPREMWMTEHNLNSNSGITYPNDHTWNYIWLFMNDVDMTIRINHEAAFIWWSSKRFYSMIGDGTYGSRDGEILPRGWGLAHYAKFAKETYRVGVAFTGKTKDGANLVEGTNVNGSRTDDFTSQTVKVSAFVKLRDGERFTVNWRNKNVPIADIEEITYVMFTPTAQTGSGGYDMGTVKLQLPAGFRISSATAMRSDPAIFHRGGTERGTPQWETVPITADRNAAFVELPVSTILSVRFTQ